MKMNALLSPLRTLLAIIPLSWLLLGCATVHDMGVTRATEKLKLDGNGLVLMSLEVANDYRPDFQPEVIVTHLETPDAKEKSDRHNFKPDLEGTVRTASGTRYLMRMMLPPGRYVMSGATCNYHNLLITAFCFLPIHADIQVAPDTVTYIGRVSGVIRERKDGELRAGPVIPLIAQGITGFGYGTFDVAISDRQEEDLRQYLTLFPSLASARIGVSVLPPFDLARAKAWEAGNQSAQKPGESPTKLN